MATTLGGQEHLASGEARLGMKAGLDPAALYRDHYHVIYRYVRCRVATHETAEDLVADVFFRAMAKASSYLDLRGSPLPWLYRIAAHRVADHYRRWRPDWELAPDDGWAAPGPEPSEEVAQRAAVAAVWRASLTLPLTQRTALWMRYGVEMEMGEIALAMGKSQEAAKLLVHRARCGVRSSLRGEWTPGDVDPGGGSGA